MQRTSRFRVPSFRAWLPVAALAAVIATTTVSARAQQALQRVRELCGAAASAGHAHGGVPIAITPQQLRGPYALKLWADPNVGIGMLYVVVVPKDGTPFAAPRRVRVAVRRAGTTADSWYDARPESVRHGARFAAPVALARADSFEVRVLVDGVAGPGEARALFEAIPPARPGVLAMLLYVAPFVLVAGLWGPGRRALQQHSAGQPATLPSP